MNPNDYVAMVVIGILCVTILAAGQKKTRQEIEDEQVRDEIRKFLKK